MGIKELLISPQSRDIPCAFESVEQTRDERANHHCKYDRKDLDDKLMRVKKEDTCNVTCVTARKSQDHWNCGCL